MAPDSKDWLYAGAALTTLLRSPLTEHFAVLTRSGLRQIGPANAALLSVLSESLVIWRHRSLGYHINFHNLRLKQAGPAVLAWVLANFEPVQRRPDDVRRDYIALIDAVRAHADTSFLILNAITIADYNDVYNYAPFDQPMGNVLTAIHAKEMNLMLYDLARERDVAIVDADLIAAELGAIHVPDGVHHSGQLQAEIRAEILFILRARGVRGFVGAAAT